MMSLLLVPFQIIDKFERDVTSACQNLVDRIPHILSSFGSLSEHHNILLASLSSLSLQVWRHFHVWD